MKPLIAILLTGTLLTLAACKEAPPAPVKQAEPEMRGNRLHFPAGHPQLSLLGTASAEPATALVMDMPGRLVWNEEKTQRVYPAFAGRVTAIAADVGHRVRRGSVLAESASPDFGTVQAEAAKAQVDSQLAGKALTRQRELFDAGIVARKDLETAQADAARAQAETQRTDARSRLYGGPAGQVTQQLALRSGIDGVVVERNLTPGQEIRPDQNGPSVPPLFVISDPTSLWVMIDFRESEVGELKPGTSFELMLPGLPDRKLSGRITVVPDAIDPATRTIKVRGVIANPDRLLKAEMLATVRISRPVASGVLVPTQAVMLRGTEHSVIVQVEPGVYEKREIAVGHPGPHEVLVTAGLAAGEKVVTENTLLLARLFRRAEEEQAARAAPAASAASTASSASR